MFMRPNPMQLLHKPLTKKQINRILDDFTKRKAMIRVLESKRDRAKARAPKTPKPTPPRKNARISISRADALLMDQEPGTISWIKAAGNLSKALVDHTQWLNDQVNYYDKLN